MLDEEPFLPPAVVDLALWVGEYYASGPGDALAIAMPPWPHGRAKGVLQNSACRRAVCRRAASAALKGAKQRAALDATPTAAAVLPLADLTAAGVECGDRARRWQRAGRPDTTTRCTARSVPAGATTGAMDAGLGREQPRRTLTTEQAHAFRRLEEAAATRTFRTVLLHGVTGSGKTELYLSLARRDRRGGRVLMLVPEIALTPALAGLFARALRRSRRDSAQRALRRRAPRPVAPHPPRRRRHRRRHAVGRVRAARTARRSSSSTRSTNRRTSRTSRRAITAATSPWCAAGWRARSSCSAPRRRRSSRRRTPRQGATTQVGLTQRILDRPLADVRIVDMRREYAAHGRGRRRSARRCSRRSRIGSARASRRSCC